MRDLGKDSDWQRRCFRVDGVDFEGDFESGVKKLMATDSKLVVNGEVGTKFRSIAEAVGVSLFRKRDAVSTSLMLDLLVRWFIQHPPAKDWMLGYIAQWWGSHPRGRPATKPDAEYEENWWMRSDGFESQKDYDDFVASRKRSMKMAKRVKMEVGDLKFEDITNVEREWLKNGRLEIPKIPPPEMPGRW